MNNNEIELTVLINGRPVRTYLHEGKTFIEAREGTEYSLRVKNKSGKRIKAVLSVDGLSILTGKKCSNGKDEPGYIISAYSEEIFSGYRIDSKKVAAFKFVTKKGSYAAEKGNISNVGVIGLRAYAENVNIEVKSLPYATEWITFTSAQNKTSYVNNVSSYLYNCSYNEGTVAKSLSNTNTKSSSSDSLKCSAQAFDMGSTFGKSMKEEITFTTFEAGYLLEEIILYYSSRKGLEKLGIKLSTEKKVNYPSAFNNFCEPPKDWKG